MGDGLKRAFNAAARSRGEPPIYCKYCGAKLRRDDVGPKCPSRNCQWEHGLPVEEGGLIGRKRRKPI